MLLRWMRMSDALEKWHLLPGMFLLLIFYFIGWGFFCCCFLVVIATFPFILRSPLEIAGHTKRGASPTALCHQVQFPLRSILCWEQKSISYSLDLQQNRDKFLSPVHCTLQSSLLIRIPSASPLISHTLFRSCFQEETFLVLTYCNDKNNTCGGKKLPWSWVAVLGLGSLGWTEAISMEGSWVHPCCAISRMGIWGWWEPLAHSPGDSWKDSHTDCCVMNLCCL